MGLQKAFVPSMLFAPVCPIPAFRILQMFRMFRFVVCKAFVMLKSLAGMSLSGSFCITIRRTCCLLAFSIAHTCSRAHPRMNSCVRSLRLEDEFPCWFRTHQGLKPLMGGSTTCSDFRSDHSDLHFSQPQSESDIL